MALNKIMFFAHGWSMAQRGRPLLNATFEAWQHGPVLPIIYRQFSSNGRRPIENRATRIDAATGRDVEIEPQLSAEDAEYVAGVTELLAPVSAIALSDLSHEPGGPWDTVWNSKQRINPGMVISHALIEAHFRGKTPSRKGGYVH